MEKPCGRCDAMSDNKVATIHLGDVIYADIDSNEYLREIHDNLLYNWRCEDA